MSISIMPDTTPYITKNYYFSQDFIFYLLIINQQYPHLVDSLVSGLSSING